MGWYNQGKGGILLTELSKIARKALKLVQKGEWRTVNPNLINVLSDFGYVEFTLEDTGEEDVVIPNYRITEAGQAFLDAWRLNAWKTWTPIVFSAVSTISAVAALVLSLITFLREK